MNDEHKLSDGLVALCSIIVGSDKIIGQSEPWTVENQFSSAALGPSGWAIEMGWSTSYFFWYKTHDAKNSQQILCTATVEPYVTRNPDDGRVYRMLADQKLLIGRDLEGRSRSPILSLSSVTLTSQPPLLS